MNKISYKFLSVSKDIPADSYWDMALLKDIFKDNRFTDEPSDGGIVVLPGEYHARFISQVNKELSKYKWVVLIVTSDEQSKFPVEKIKHKNIDIYIQYPKYPRHKDYKAFPLGYTSETRKHLKLVDKDIDYFISAQDTHQRRHDCFENLKNVPNGVIKQTEGFTQGLEPKEYMEFMNRAKTAPAPAGPICADSFRTYEALEAGAIPIADNISEAGDSNYYNKLFNNPPFPTINFWHDLPGYIADNLNQTKANKIQAWWITEKEDLKDQLIESVKHFTNLKYAKDITVIVPVSPIKSHPSTEKLEQSIKSIRHHLPDSEIIITFDGVNPHQEDRRADYVEFTRRALFHCNTEWNATPIIFDNHTHQVGMARKILEFIESPYILYVEGDTGLVLDRQIDWDYCKNKLADGTSNLIRFHFEAIIPKEHSHLIHGKQDKLIKTSQWSQRPHLATTAYYKRILASYFTLQAKCMIEDKMHGIVAEAYNIDNILGWNQHRLHIYAPDKNLKYSVNFDGREDEPKYDNEYVY